MAELPTDEYDEDVLALINGVENEQRKNDCKELLKLFSEITGEPPKMWRSSIVGFGSYHYKYESGREGDWFLTGFAPRKNNLSIYITSGFKEHEDLMEDLGKYKTGSSCLYVNKLSDIDTSKLVTLVEKSVQIMKKKYA